MAGGNRKIHEHPNAGKGNFSKNPQNAGRKRKLYSDHIADMRKKGYEPPTKKEYFDMVGMLLSMVEDDLKDFALDKSRPYWIRLIIMDMGSKATRQKMMSDYRDWLYGRAEQKTEVEFTDNTDCEITDFLMLRRKAREDAANSK